MKTLRQIQLEINGNKDNENKFAGFNYRNAEELFNEIKPMLDKYDCYMTVDNELVEAGGKAFIKSTVTFIHGDFTKSASAIAGIDFERKGLDYSQACGSAQSYATKYALCSLLLLSDSKLDSDSMPRKGEEAKQQPTKYVNFNDIRSATTIQQLSDIYHNQVEGMPDGNAKKTAIDIVKKKKAELLKKEAQAA